MKALFVTHPEVQVDPAVAIPRWSLSAVGRRRMQAFTASQAAAGIGEVWASAETKAQEAAAILAAGSPVHTHDGLGENDRSSTGFRPPAEFQRLADAFFAHPAQSVEGWERAIDAQRRVVQAFEAILAGRRGGGDLAVVAHGGVGALLYCHLTGQPIDRRHDQPFQGCYWVWDVDAAAMVHGWRPIAPRET